MLKSSVIFPMFDKVDVYVTCLFKVAQTACVRKHPTAAPFVNTERTNREMEGTDNPTNSETGRQTDRQTERQTDGQTDR